MMSYDEMAGECARLRTANVELIAALEAMLREFPFPLNEYDMSQAAQTCIGARAALAKAEQVTP